MFRTIASYIAKVRTWGLKGVWNFFVGKVEARRLRNYFLENAARHPTTPADDGLTIVAPFHASYSLGKVMRDFAFRLRDAGIPFQAFDTSKASDIPDSDIDALITPREEFRILKYRNVVELLFGPVPAEVDHFLMTCRIRLAAADAGITNVTCRGNLVYLEKNKRMLRRDGLIPAIQGNPKPAQKLKLVLRTVREFIPRAEQV